jgi:prenyltransferase beta subunit
MFMKCTGLAWIFVLAFVAPTPAQTQGQKQDTIDYLRSLQTDSGGFLPLRPESNKGMKPVPSLRATSGALRALKYFGGAPRDKAACVKFVVSCYRPEIGAFADNPSGAPDVVTTAIGIMALIELEQADEACRPKVLAYLDEKAKTFEEIRIAAAGSEALGKRPPQATEWLKEIAALRKADGTYGKGEGVARATGGAVVALLRLGGELSERTAVVKALKEGQRADGAFGKEGEAGSDLESTYRVIRAFVMLKEKPDSTRCLAFVARCRNADGGYGIAPGKPSGVGTTYYAAILTHWLAE